MSSQNPPERVAAKARELELGAFERRVRRRPGLPGAVVCLVLLCVGGNFLRNGPHNALVVTGLALAALIVLWWGYLWIRRVNGGLYLFKGGFVDAAGLRLMAVTWAEVTAVTTDSTRYSVNSLPVGTTLHYKVMVRRATRDWVDTWELNTTYEDVSEIGFLIARRAGVEVEYTKEP
ncbi:MAG TPA: DUF6585 family protein [Phytomonospora sp.]